MFTGIIETMASVVECKSGRLVIERPRSFTGTRVGSSICVSGVCLTVTAIDAPHPSTSSGQAPNPLPRGEGKRRTLAFDVVPETLKRTTLGKLRKGSCVNLERALLVGGRFEGHVVQGHAEGVGTVMSHELWVMSVQGNSQLTTHNSQLTIELPKHLLPYVVEKGSIAIDGVSLTVAKLHANQCTVALIPHTLKHTTLGSLKRGDGVNIETDILARYVLSQLKMDN